MTQDYLCVMEHTLFHGILHICQVFYLVKNKSCPIEVISNLFQQVMCAEYKTEMVWTTLILFRNNRIFLANRPFVTIFQNV